MGTAPGGNRIAGNGSTGKIEAYARGRLTPRIGTRKLANPVSGVPDINLILAQVPPDVLGLFIPDSRDLVLIERTERVVLGRQTDASGTSISIDLTPYGGAESGVSRQHAALLIHQGMYLLQDLESSNGTRLNGFSLLPHASHMLKCGDVIQLGLISIQIVFHGLGFGKASEATGLHDRSFTRLLL